MTTKSEQIVAAIETLLKQAPQTPAGNNVYRNRQEPFVRGPSPSISLIKANDTPNLPGGTGRVYWDLLVRLVVIGRDADAPDGAVDATLEAIHSKMYTDRTLGGLAVDVVVGPVAYEQDGEVKEACVATREYHVTYMTPEETL